ncbi:MAG TPA: hypothetical protein VHK27_03170, partial [Gammaproteobacteria bacterium]|nr:hypothetical protein [Gammaproteobacteria bacterium]
GFNGRRPKCWTRRPNTQGGNTTRSMTESMANALQERFPTLRWLTAEAYPLKPVTFTDYRIKGWDSG